MAETKKKYALIGRRIGRLIVLEAAHYDQKLGRLFKCRCDCGAETIVPGSNLFSENTKSCGCLKQIANDLPYRGASRLREFQIWKLMRFRCFDPDDRAYPRYGGRGIKVCERWAKSFSAFLEDMGLRPSHQHTLDRINTDGNYEPTNCRWATWDVQQNNRRNNRYIEFRGEKRTAAQWGQVTGLSRSIIYQRIHKLGWSPEVALTLPRQGVAAHG